MTTRQEERDHKRDGKSAERGRLADEELKRGQEELRAKESPVLDVKDEIVRQSAFDEILRDHIRDALDEDNSPASIRWQLRLCLALVYTVTVANPTLPTNISYVPWAPPHYTMTANSFPERRSDLYRRPQPVRGCRHAGRLDGHLLADCRQRAPTRRQPGPW